MDANVLKSMFDASQHQNGDGGKFTAEEASRFKKAFDDPEFRKMFSEYMDELQDPRHREETEAYISQLEGEQKVPEGKELIRPQPGFVAKTHKLMESGKAVKEKIFINVVQSDKIARPTKKSTPKGDCWSVPYSVGPPHMEKDKKGENSACFDCCFHSEALILSDANVDFKNLLVTTAMDGVEALYKRQEQDVKLDRQFHVVKGLNYKEGVVPSMIIAVANKDAWNDTTSSDKKAPKQIPSIVSPKNSNEASKSIVSIEQPQKETVVSQPTKTKTAPAIKRGFLNSSKSSLYPEKIPTIRPKTNPEEPAKDITEEEKKQHVDELIREMEKASIRSQELAQINTRDLSEEVDVLKAVSTKIKAKPSEKILSVGTGDDSGEKRPAIPLVVCKHREASSMGDFEAMKSQQVASRRPTELIYEINLPLVTTPSKIILDVSEKKLLLSYTDAYKLEMDLPFVVHDKKGKAAYDKAKKVLKVTLPVEQSDPTPVISAIPPSSSSIQEIAPKNNAVMQQQDEVLPSVRTFTTTTTTHPRKEKHSRWVESSVQSEAGPNKTIAATSSIETSMNPENDEISESKKLFQEVQRQAEAAKKKYKEEQVQSPINQPILPVAKSVLENGSTEKITVSSNFISALSFQGAKKGYVFKRGEEGMGYYLDRKDISEEVEGNNEISGKQEEMIRHSPTQIANMVSQPSRDAFTYTEFPFESRLNQDTLSILVQVKNILPESVSIVVESYSISIKFEAFHAVKKDEYVYYGMCLALDKRICGDGLNLKKYKHDVAGKNMVIVVAKSNRDEDWDEDANAEWLNATILPPKLDVASSHISADETKSPERQSQPCSSSPKKTIPSQDVNTANALNSIISTMRFSTDFVSELD